jgi:hypothetical protein
MRFVFALAVASILVAGTALAEEVEQTPLTAPAGKSSPVMENTKAGKSWHSMRFLHAPHFKMSLWHPKPEPEATPAPAVEAVSAKPAQEDWWGDRYWRTTRNASKWDQASEASSGK